MILTQEESVLERVSGAPACRAQRTRVYSKSIWIQQLEGHWIWTQEPGCEQESKVFVLFIIFSCLDSVWLITGSGVRASHCSGFSCGRTQTLGNRGFSSYGEVEERAT